MQKRGVSQLDWIMSLALFLLYIAWFFVFITPNINFTSNKDSMMILLKNNFNNEFNWKLTKFPVFIDINTSGMLKPIIMDYFINNTNITFMEDNDYIIWNSRLIFLANMSAQREIFWLIEGKENNVSYEFKGLNINSEGVSTKNLSVLFHESMPETAVYSQDIKFNDASYKINDVSFDPSNYSYNDFGFVALYTSGTDNINHTSMVFADNPEIYNFITLQDPGSEYVLEISLELDNYRSYYSNNIYYGDFEYTNSTRSINYSYDYITLYSPSDSMSLFFKDQVSFNFSYYNTTLLMKIRVPFTDNYDYKYVFHDKNFSNITRKDYDAKIGVLEPIEGISSDKITTDYEYLKEKWKFPSSRNFNILVFDNTSAYSYLQGNPLYQIGIFNPKNKNVYGEISDMYFLNNDGTYSPINVRFMIW